MGGVTSKSLPQAEYARQKTLVVPMTIAAAAADVGNTGQTHILRKTLVLGMITATGKLVEYDDDGTDDGRRTAYAILDQQVDLKRGDLTADNEDRTANVLLIGHVRSDQLIGYDAAAKTDLQVTKERIWFD